MTRRRKGGECGVAIMQKGGQLLSLTLAPFLFLLSGKKLFPGVSVELTEYCIRKTDGIGLSRSKVMLPME